MNLAIRARHATAALTGLMLVAMTMLVPASAEDQFTPSHLKAAFDALKAMKVTDQFDQVLPRAAAALESELVRKNPDMRDQIDATVEESAIKLAPRRADLEREAATIYAGSFSEDELKAIADFLRFDGGPEAAGQGRRRVT